MRTRIKNFLLKNKIYSVILIFVLAGAGVVFFHYKYSKQTSQQVKAAAVFSASLQAQKIKNACGQQPKNICYPTQFLNLAKAQGYRDAFNTLLQIQKIDPSTQDCHLIAHGIGRGAYEHDPANWQNTLKLADDSCYYGIFHGLIESYIYETGHELNKTTIEQICPFFTSPDCYHVMGHVLILNAGGSLTGGLDACHNIFGVETAKLNDCMAGVFMEYQLPEGLFEHGLVSQAGLDSKSRLPGLEKMCAGYSGDTGVACWLEIAHVAAAAYNNDMEKVFNECDKAAVLKSLDICLRHGLQIVWAANKYSLMDFVNFCPYNNKFDPDFEVYCDNWLVGNSIFVLKQERSGIIPFCYAIKASLQPACLELSTQAKE